MIEINPEKDKILRFSQKKFLNEGFYKITMDEIARDLQVSKKTIYKYFPSKENLVEEISSNLISGINCDLDSIIEGKENVVVKFVKVLNMYSNKMMYHNEKWYRDLQLHMPHIWQQIDNLRIDRVHNGLNKLLEQGRKEKLVEGIPSEIIITSIITTVRAVINPEFILKNKFSMQEAFKYTFEMFLNGILTKTGKEKYLKTKELFQIENI
jgi:AcrR family transcriptional regulator